MSLYVKYRPKNLGDIFGNSNTVEVLRQHLKKETLPKVLMFYGPSGCGKTTLARILKTELGCADNNFTELNVANTRGIDTIRDVIQASYYQTFDGGVKIFLFDEAHKLTNDAQNALLKILEDVPKKVYFILCTTDPEKLIPTIHSRCTPFPVAPLSLLPLVTLLKKTCKTEGKELPENVLREIARTAEGSPRQAMVTLEQVMHLQPDMALEMIKEIEVGEKQIIDVCRALVKKPKPKWEEIQKMLQNMEIAEPERSRVAILNYLASTLIGSGNKEISQIMSYFTETMIYSGRGGLVLALWKACHLS